MVEESDGDLMGDSVNIAARLEGIADPGGICLSEDAYRQVRDRLKEGFADLGEKELKNIARPVRVFAITRCDAGANSFHTGTRRRPRAGVFRRPAGAPMRGSRCVRSRCLIILQEPLDVVELLLRAQHVAEAAAQFLDDAARALHVDLAGYFDR